MDPTWWFHFDLSTSRAQCGWGGPRGVTDTAPSKISPGAGKAAPLLQCPLQEIWSRVLQGRKISTRAQNRTSFLGLGAKHNLDKPKFIWQDLRSDIVLWPHVLICIKAEIRSISVLGVRDAFVQPLSLFVFVFQIHLLLPNLHDLRLPSRLDMLP